MLFSFEQQVEGFCLAESEEDARQKLNSIYGDAPMFRIHTIIHEGEAPEQLELALAETQSNSIN